MPRISSASISWRMMRAPSSAVIVAPIVPATIAAVSSGPSSRRNATGAADGDAVDRAERGRDRAALDADRREADDEAHDRRGDQRDLEREDVLADELGAPAEARGDELAERLQPQRGAAAGVLDPGAGRDVLALERPPKPSERRVPVRPVMLRRPWSRDPYNPYDDKQMGLAMLGVILFCTASGAGRRRVLPGPRDRSGHWRDLRDHRRADRRSGPNAGLARLTPWTPAPVGIPYHAETVTKPSAL